MHKTRNGVYVGRGKRKFNNEVRKVNNNFRFFNSPTCCCDFRPAYAQLLALSRCAMSSEPCNTYMPSALPEGAQVRTPLYICLWTSMLEKVHDTG